MSLLYRVAADLLVTFHMAYVAFVVVGFALILLGIACRWQWIRSVWFRLVHLACILIVVGEALLGITCPLTVWEKQLRGLAGQSAYHGDFIANWVHEALFMDLAPSTFTLLYSAFGIAVLLTFILAPPRRRKPALPSGQ